VVTPRFQLAQVNIGQVRAPLDSELLADFVAALAPINALADRSPGFVWRLQTEAGNATALRIFGDDRLLVNMSVWESLDALADFVYRSAHAGVLRQRRRWFFPLDRIILALWWVPAGHRPSIAEAEERLRILETRGPCPEAFTFRMPFPPPGESQAVEPVAEGCTA
jgi:hypothetical protein